MKPVGLREVKAEERVRRRETIGCGHPGRELSKAEGEVSRLQNQNCVIVVFFALKYIRES